MCVCVYSVTCAVEQCTYQFEHLGIHRPEKIVIADSYECGEFICRGNIVCVCERHCGGAHIQSGAKLNLDFFFNLTLIFNQNVIT